MHEQNNKSAQTDGVHPAVLQVSGDETRRWCAAIWSVDPGEQRLVSGIRGLIESTLVAHWMQPPLQYEPITPAVNSFDLVFYESVDDTLGSALETAGFHQVPLQKLVIDEYEQFEVFVDEARKVGREVSGHPSALWRADIEPADAPGDADWGELGEKVAEMFDDQVWGDTPGWFSRAYCGELEQVADVTFGPDRSGLVTLAEAVVPTVDDGIGWVDPIAYQALCDFIGVVVQATTDLEVQWGTCPVDEETGLAPAPLMRMRQRGGQWHRINVGVDVLRTAALPWGDGLRGPEAVAELVDRYDDIVTDQ